MAGVTKRTVDYYTNIGLLQAERSPSNYRIYQVGELEKLHRIVEFKQNHFSLEEIKTILQADREAAELDDTGRQLNDRMHGLNEELQKAIYLIEKDESKEKRLKKQLSHESAVLLQSLLVLLS